MISIRFAVLAVAVLLLPASASAQRGKVFTNEDIARPAPSRPAAPEAAAEQQQPAAADAAQATPASAEQLTGPQAELKRALELQEIFQQSRQEYNRKFNQETNPARLDRWDRMIICLTTLLQQNLRYINELQESQQ